MPRKPKSSENLTDWPLLPNIINLLLLIITVEKEPLSIKHHLVKKLIFQKKKKLYLTEYFAQKNKQLQQELNIIPEHLKDKYFL